MKSNASKVCAIALVAGLALTSCGKKDASQQVKSNGLPKAGSNTAASSCGVAVINVDTLSSQYEFCKEGQKTLEAKQSSLQKQLTQRGQALQNAMQDFQNKLQNGTYTSQQQAEAAQKKLQQQQQSLQSYQEQIEKEMQTEAQKYQDELRTKLNAFLKEYNKDGRYKVIISKSGDNVLYMDASVDITNDVVAGLNQSYKSEKK